MPNHCTNELRVSGPRESRERFKTKAASPDLPVYKPSRFELPGELEVKQLAYMQDAQIALNTCPMNFHAFVPVPPEVQRETYNDAGYDWQRKHWGTKWNAYDQDLEEDADSLLYRFDTAWCPPYGVLRAMSTQFPDLHFEDTWFEEGGSAGYITLQFGKSSEVPREHPGYATLEEKEREDADPTSA